MALAGTKVVISRARGNDLLKRFVLRFREPGHLRFDLPREFSAGQRADLLVTALLRLDGVYRVLVFSGPGKLSIRYDTAAIEEMKILKHLAEAVATLPKVDAQASIGPSSANGLQALKGKLLSLPMVRWGEEKLHQGRLTAEAVKHLIELKSGRRSPLPFDPKEWGIHFINDLVAFYLIRIHWARITKLWLPSPWSYRYQWLTIIYLTFILVRHRKAALKRNAGK